MKEKRGSIIKLLRIIGAIFISSFIYFLLIKFTGDKLVEKGYTFDFGFIFNNNQYLTMMLQGYKNTIIISFFFFFFCVILGIIISIL